MHIKLYWLLAPYEIVFGNILEKANLIMNKCKMYSLIMKANLWGVKMSVLGKCN